MKRRPNRDQVDDFLRELTGVDYKLTDAEIELGASMKALMVDVLSGIGECYPGHSPDLIRGMAFAALAHIVIEQTGFAAYRSLCARIEQTCRLLQKLEKEGGTPC